MKKVWKTVALLGTAALAVTGGICLIRKFFNPDEELEDFDDDDLFDDEEKEEDAEIFEDEAKEDTAEETKEEVKEEKPEEAPEEKEEKEEA